MSQARSFPFSPTDVLSTISTFLVNRRHVTQISTGAKSSGRCRISVSLLLPCLFALCLFTLCFATLPAFAQEQGNGAITGVITDSTQGNPLPGANVVVPTLNRGSSTDRDGKFQIERVPAGTYELAVSYIGYQKKRVSVTVEAEEEASVDVMLPQATTGMGEVTISASPIVGSQAEALSRREAAPVVKNVISSDQVGKFPDQNVAAAISRVPGVAVERDQGQARHVNLRGTPKRWTRLAINGLNVIGSQGRIVRFDEIPAPIISTVEVTKAVPPDKPASSIAGRINVETASAFDNPGFHVSGEGSPGYLGMSRDFQYETSAQISNTWNETVGVVLSASRYRRNQVTSNAEIGYEIGPDGELWPDEVDSRTYYLERTNNALSGRLDFRPSETQEFFVSSTYVEFNDNEERNQYVFNLGAASNFQGGSNTPIEGTLSGVPMEGLLGPGYYRNSTWTTMVGGESRFGAWDISYRGSFTRTKSSIDLPVMQPQTSPSLNVEYDFNDFNFPSLDLSTSSGSSVNDLSQTDYASNFGLDLIQESDTDAYAAKVDVERNWSPLGLGSDIQFGTKFETRTKSGFDFATGFIPYSPASPVDFEGNLMDENLRSDFPFPNRYDLERLDVFGLEDEFDRAAEEVGYNRSDAIPDENRYTVQEDIYAGYIMNTWSPSWGSVLAGVRVEHASYDSEGFQVVGDSPEPVSNSTGETKFFPGLHVNVDVTEDIRLRAAGTRTVGRAGFVDRRPSVSINDSDESIDGGNPSIEAEKAWGADLSLEYYLSGAGIASISTFGKWISDPQFESETIVNDNQFDTDEQDRTGYTYETILNGQDGRIYGVELQYFQQWTFLPGALAGLGVQTNATFLDSEFTTPSSPSTAPREASFPGTSDTILNGSVFYERYGLSTRLSYQWRDDWIDSLDPADERRDTYWDNEARLSASARYSFSDNYAVFAEVSNLTDELGRRYQSSESRQVQVEGYGRRYQIGVRVNY
ncbi:TonB-dependent receptor [Salinibacter altiplanensis]|uniref:TonB-dependent receptor n=1 Tax=Salinibacter altiplanensis TaxID=1803181 RepID=UPI000C9F5CA0|nr:TonB-dependent receptor [Salinibacter altiplanensis]